MSESTTTPLSKREVMLALLEHAEAQVHLDARRDGVMLPERLLGSSNVRLDYGYGLTPPIPDLSVDESGIRATLFFNRAPFPTFVPWSAVFFIADFAGRGAVWREDLPPELVNQADAATGEAASDDRRITERDLAPPRRLGLVDSDVRPAPSAVPDTSEPPADEPEPPRPRPTLRLVK